MRIPPFPLKILDNTQWSLCNNSNHLVCHILLQSSPTTCSKLDGLYCRAHCFHQHSYCWFHWPEFHFVLLLTIWASCTRQSDFFHRPNLLCHSWIPTSMSSSMKGKFSHRSMHPPFLLWYLLSLDHGTPTWSLILPLITSKTYWLLSGHIKRSYGFLSYPQILFLMAQFLVALIISFTPCQ